MESATVASHHTIYVGVVQSGSDGMVKMDVYFYPMHIADNYCYHSDEDKTKKKNDDDDDDDDDCYYYDFVESYVNGANSNGVANIVYVPSTMHHPCKYFEVHKQIGNDSMSFDFHLLISCFHSHLQIYLVVAKQVVFSSNCAYHSLYYCDSYYVFYQSVYCYPFCLYYCYYYNHNDELYYFVRQQDMREHEVNVSLHYYY